MCWILYEALQLCLKLICLPFKCLKVIFMTAYTLLRIVCFQLWNLVEPKVRGPWYWFHAKIQKIPYFQRLSSLITATMSALFRFIAYCFRPFARLLDALGLTKFRKSTSHQNLLKVSKELTQSPNSRTNSHTSSQLDVFQGVSINPDKATGSEITDKRDTVIAIQKKFPVAHSSNKDRSDSKNKRTSDFKRCPIGKINPGELSPLPNHQNNSIKSDEFNTTGDTLSKEKKAAAESTDHQIPQKANTPPISEGSIILPNEKLDDSNTINILLMGESGVGKSTFINALANYLAFETLNDAQRSEPRVLIHSKFIITNKNDEQKTIEFGQVDSNEKDSCGASRTQSCKSYSFWWKGKKVTFIDTPGINDTRGIEEDEKNARETISYISQYSVISGICFLLKPNHSRMTVGLQRCLQGFLGQLHKSATSNIIFVFTNTRGTIYRVGETYPALKNYLMELSHRNPEVKIDLTPDRYFCLDNEAFRFLAMVNDKQDVDVDDASNFEKSWIKSAAECKRMIEVISKIEPHAINDSVRLNQTKSLIQLLGNVLAEATVNIQKKILKLNADAGKNKNIMQEIGNLEEEQTSIIKVRAELNHYVASMGITPHFDSGRDNMEAIINTEKKKQTIVFDIERNQLIERLVEVQKSYDSKLNTFKGQWLSSKSSLVENSSNQDVLTFLYNLKETGKFIQNSVRNNY